MPRRKGSAVKLMAGESPERQFGLTVFGSKMDDLRSQRSWLLAIERVSECETLWEMVRLSNSPELAGPRPVRKNAVAGWLAEHGVELFDVIALAVEKGDPTWFLRMAEAVEAFFPAGEPADPLRFWLMRRYRMQSGSLLESSREPLETMSEMRERYERDHGTTVDERALRRACEELGVRIKPGTPGPKRRTKGRRT